MADPSARVVLRTLPKSIEASVYNHVRLALLRLGRPLRIEVPRHRGLDVIFDDDVWLVVDSCADDQPILAWLDFARHGRDDLHAPVACTLELYHRCAGLIMGTALDALDEALAARLKPHGDHDSP